VQVVDLIVGEMQKLGHTLPTGAELTARKASVVGNFNSSVETVENTANLLSRFELYHVDLGEIGRYADRVKAVTPDQIEQIGAELFDPSKAQIVVVGDASVFLKALKAEHPDVDVIPAADVDFGNASMRKGGS
jgi:zinc protease